MSTTTISAPADYKMYRVVEVSNPEIIIAEGNDLDKVLAQGEASGKDYLFVFVPAPNTTYIY